MTKRIAKAAVAGLLLGALAAPMVLRPAWSQGFPTKPIRLVVPFPRRPAAGHHGPPDRRAHGHLLGQSVIIDNKPGRRRQPSRRNSSRGPRRRLHALLGNAPLFCANKFLFGGNIPFDTIKDFTHLTRVSIGTTVLVINAKEPWQNFAEFVAYAKGQPGQDRHGLVGQGTISHLTRPS